MLLAFGNGAFDLFANFWVTKLKLFSGKVRQSIEDYLNPKLVIGSISEICFEANLRSKRMSWAFGKSIFHFFEIFEWWSLKPFIGKARQSVKNILDPKVGHMKIFRKWFWSYLQLKTKCSEPLKMAFFSFLQIFKRWSWNRFLGKWENASKTFFIKSNLLKAF